ncbi:hypothetical protein D3C86_1113140 [compost metagenome]
MRRRFAINTYSELLIVIGNLIGKQIMQIIQRQKYVQTFTKSPNKSIFEKVAYAYKPYSYSSHCCFSSSVPGVKSPEHYDVKKERFIDYCL